MRRCEELLRDGVPVLLFPEGTRSRDGSLQPFRDGAFRLAIAARCPVIPIAVSGTAESLPKHGLVLRKPMRARVRVLPAIDPAVHSDVASLRDAARGACQACRDMRARTKARARPSIAARPRAMSAMPAK